VSLIFFRKSIPYLFLGTLCLSSCGYHLVGGGNLPPHIETVAIPIFINKTQERGVEDIVTRAVINEFLTGGKIRLTESSRADAKLTGEILSYSLQATQYNTNSQITQYKLTIGANMKLEDLTSRKVLWEQQNLTEDQDFNVSPGISPIELDNRERTALEDLSVELAGRVLDLATEGF
jgi:outer membrane lipopolysaccharide assembly protein LptE/RlpB